jgi:hypothetical protein
MSEETKKCIKCECNKQICLFIKNKNICFDCNITYQKNYYKNNKEKIKKYKTNYRNNNKEQIKEKDKKYYIYNKEKIKTFNKLNKSKNKEYQKKYYKNNKNKLKEKDNKYKKYKYKTDLNYKLKSNISKSICEKLKKQNLKKLKSTLKYVDYTIQDLKEHLEKMFEPWMNWNNWGLYKASEWNDNDNTTWTWQIDHILPQSSFNFTDEEQIKKCWELENLRPLSAKENILKRDKILNEDITS